MAACDPGAAVLPPEAAVDRLVEKIVIVPKSRVAEMAEFTRPLPKSSFRLI
ncbi:MAG: hypothetical protein ACREEQ_13970 [Caulobacteraceae bacterium]